MDFSFVRRAVLGGERALSARRSYPDRAMARRIVECAACLELFMGALACTIAASRGRLALRPRERKASTG
jgi:hypothetical protein